MDKRHLLGYSAEFYARCYLRWHRIKIIRKNYRCRSGEVDVIARDHNNTLLFIEVRFRSEGLDQAAQSVILHKQQKITQVAEIFIKTYPKWAEYFCRFDVIAISKTGLWWQLQWIKNAF